jgi:hypothetical protein
MANTPNATYEFTFDEPGVYRYYCRIHGTPGGVGQAGVVVVGGAGEPAPQVPAAVPLTIQPGAVISVLSPLDGQQIAGDKVDVNLSVVGASVRASVPGITDPRFGHYHLILDTTIDMTEEVPRAGTVPGVFHVAANTFTLEGLTPGEHTLTVLWGFDNHYPSIQPIFETVRFTTTGGSSAAAPIRAPSAGDGGLLGQ